jgi:hypothetical protein
MPSIDPHLKERYGAHPQPGVHRHSTQCGQGPAGHQRPRLVRRAGPAGQERSGQLGDKIERRENLTGVRDEPDNDRNDSRENRDARETCNGRDDRKSDRNRDRHPGSDSGEYPEQDFRREQRAALSAGMDA